VWHKYKYPIKLLLSSDKEDHKLNTNKNKQNKGKNKMTLTQKLTNEVSNPVSEMQSLADDHVKSISAAFGRNIPPVRIDGSHNDESGELIMAYDPKGIIYWVGSYNEVPDSAVLLHELGHHLMYTQWPRVTKTLQDGSTEGEIFEEGVCEYFALDVFPKICAISEEDRLFGLKEKLRIQRNASKLRITDKGYTVIKNFMEKKEAGELLNVLDNAERNQGPAYYLRKNLGVVQ
jgi:hypothetical protein